MNKRQIIASLNNIANTLDNSGFNREADIVTNVMVKLAEEETESYGKEPAKKIIDDFVDQAKRNERYDASILKMMNDRLEFNGHERMSEKKFKEMIGKNKEANSTEFMKRLAEEDNSKSERAIERFKRSCDAIKNSPKTMQEKRTERMISRQEISERLEGEDLKKFDKAANNIGID